MPTQNKFNIDPEALFQGGLKLGRIALDLQMPPRTASLERIGAGHLGVREQGLAETIADALARKEAEPITKVLGVDGAALGELVAQHRAADIGVRFFGHVRDKALGWEVCIGSSEVLARGLVLSRAQALLESGQLSRKRSDELRRRIEVLQQMESELLAPELQSRRVTIQLKADTQAKADEIEKQRQLLLTMAKMAEGARVDPEQLKDAALFYAELTGDEEDVQEEEKEERRGKDR